MDQNSCCRFSGSLRRLNPCRYFIGAAIIAPCPFFKYFGLQCHRHVFSGRQHAHQAQTLQVAGGIVGAILYTSSVNPINPPQSNQAEHGGMPSKCWIRVWFSYIHWQVRVQRKTIHAHAPRWDMSFVCMAVWAMSQHSTHGQREHLSPVGCPIAFTIWCLGGTDFEQHFYFMGENGFISSWKHFGYERLLCNQTTSEARLWLEEWLNLIVFRRTLGLQMAWPWGAQYDETQVAPFKIVIVPVFWILYHWWCKNFVPLAWLWKIDQSRASLCKQNSLTSSMHWVNMGDGNSPLVQPPGFDGRYVVHAVEFVPPSKQYLEHMLFIFHVLRSGINLKLSVCVVRGVLFFLQGPSHIARGKNQPNWFTILSESQFWKPKRLIFRTSDSDIFFWWRLFHLHFSIAIFNLNSMADPKGLWCSGAGFPARSIKGAGWGPRSPRVGTYVFPPLTWRGWWV